MFGLRVMLCCGMQCIYWRD